MVLGQRMRSYVTARLPVGHPPPTAGLDNIDKPKMIPTTHVHSFLADHMVAGVPVRKGWMAQIHQLVIISIIRIGPPAVADEAQHICDNFLHMTNRYQREISHHHSISRRDIQATAQRRSSSKGDTSRVYWECSQCGGGG